MAEQKDVQQYVLLPPRGLSAGQSAESADVAPFLQGLNTQLITAAASTYTLGAGPKVQLRVLDSIHEDGAKLVEMSLQSATNLRAHEPGVRIVPVVYYRPAVAPRPMPVSSPRAAATAAAGVATKVTVTVVSAKDGSSVVGATVVAFTSFARRAGSQGTTNAKGQVTLLAPAAGKKIDRLYVYPEKSYWPALKKQVALSADMQIQLTPLDLAFTDALRFFYGSTPTTAGQGVKVGVVDTGIAPHPDLVIDGGRNTVTGELETDIGDNGEGHGTHVAGIIAARGTPPIGIRGMAPAITLRSYRVFGQGNPQASNFAIAKAIALGARDDGCDLLNLSLGGGPPDAATRSAIDDARAQGAVVIVAAGNDERQPVSFPAAIPLCVAVTALGRKGTFPTGTVEVGAVAPPPGTDPKNFIADFSNIGPEVDLTGPGVGIISTFPGGYAALDGTSMACPAVTGVAARILAAHPEILNMPRDAARADAMAKAIFQCAKLLGFGPTFEGQGILML
jgi:subtilisin